MMIRSNLNSARCWSSVISTAYSVISTAYEDLERDVCDLNRMAKIASEFTAREAETSWKDTKKLRKEGLALFAVERLGKMIEDFERRYYEMYIRSE